MTKTKHRPALNKKPKRQSEETAHYRAFYDTAMAFLRAEPWQRWNSNEHFAVSMPGEEHSWWVTILGCYGLDHGIALHRGPDAYEQMLMMEDQEIDEEMRSELDVMSCSYEPYGSILKQVRIAVDQSGARPSARELVPMCFAKQPFKRGRACTLREHEQLALLMRAVLRALDEGLLTRSMKPRPILLVEGAIDDFSVSVSPFVPPYAQASPPVAPPLPLVDREKLRELPLRPETWHVGMPLLPIGIASMDDEIRALVVVEEASQIVLASEVVHGEQAARMAALALAKVFDGANYTQSRGLPRTLRFNDRKLFAAVEPMVSPLGVRCIFADEPHPALAEAIDGVSAAMSKMP